MATPEARNDGDTPTESAAAAAVVYGPAERARDRKALTKVVLTIAMTGAAAVALSVDTTTERFLYWYLMSAISLHVSRSTRLGWQPRAAFHGFAGFALLTAITWTPSPAAVWIEEGGFLLLTWGAAIDGITTMWRTKNDEPT